MVYFFLFLVNLVKNVLKSGGKCEVLIWLYSFKFTPLRASTALKTFAVVWHQGALLLFKSTLTPETVCRRQQQSWRPPLRPVQLRGLLELSNRFLAGIWMKQNAGFGNCTEPSTGRFRTRVCMSAGGLMVRERPSSVKVASVLTQQQRLASNKPQRNLSDGGFVPGLVEMLKYRHVNI